MAEYKPSSAFTVPLDVYKPTYTKSGGVRTKVLPQEGFRIFGTFRTFGGTDQTVNGVYSVLDTAEVETWFRPDITSDCIIALAETGAKYEILGEPENIGQRNRFLKFKIQRVKGGA